MTAIEPAKTSSIPRTAMLDIVRPLASRRLFVIVAMVIAASLAGVAALNWRWLVAVGAVSVLVSTLPCLLMCGLGLCMHKFVGRTGPNSCNSATDGSDVSTRAMDENLLGSVVNYRPEEGPIGDDRSMQSREKINA